MTKVTAPSTVVSTRDLRWFAALGLPVLAGVLGALGWWKLGMPWLGLVCWIAGGALSIAGQVHPPLIRPIQRGLHILTAPIRWVLYYSAVIVIYFVIVTPFGLLMRWLRPSPLRSFRVPGESSCWQPRPPSPGPERYYQQH